jgi:hypothetical protein
MLVDDLSMSPTGNRDLVHAASRFVASLPPSDLVGLATTSGEASVNPTGDHQAVAARIRHTVGRLTDLRSLPPAVVVGLNEGMEIAGGNQATFSNVVSRECLSGRTPNARDMEGTCANEIERKARQMASLTQRATDMQMATYKAVINAMRPVAGEKALVILSDGLMMNARGQRPAVDIDDIERDAALSGVQVSILHPSADSVSMTARTPAEATVARDDGQAFKMGLENIAGATGGSFHRVIGQPDRFFGFVADAMSSVYHLGVEAPAGSAPGREFKLSARVKRSGVTVRANRLAMQEPTAPPISVEAQLNAVATKGELKYGVPLAVGTVIRPGPTADEIALGVNVEVPSGVSGPLSVVFAAVDERGKSRSGTHSLSGQAGGGSYRLSFSVPLATGSYRLRVGVADADGQVGSLDMPVAAQLNRFGPFRVGDIQTAWTGADGRPQFLSLGNVPSAATSLLAGLELALASAPPAPSGVSVTWAVVNEAGQTIGEQTVAATSAETRLSAQTRLSIAPLPPGTYELRATIRVANQAVGVTSTSFRKADKQACACGRDQGNNVFAGIVGPFGL